MKRTARFLAAPTIAAIILAGCGTGEQEAASPTESSEESSAADESDAWPTVEDEEGNVVENPEDEPMDGGELEPFSLTDEPYVAPTATGAQITMTMDAQPDSDEQITWLEQYREDAGGDPVTYVLSDVDNRDGTEPVNMYAITLYDPEGKSYECGQAMDYAEESWRPVWLYGSTDVDEYESAKGEPMDYDVAEELDHRLYEHDFDDTIDPFEAGTLVSICPGVLPDEVTAVEVLPGGVYIDATYATPESYMGEDG